MKSIEIQEKICETIAHVTQNVYELYSLEQSFTNIKGWDSLNKVKFLVEIEKVYKIRFSGSEINQIENIGDICEIVDLKLPKY